MIFQEPMRRVDAAWLRMDRPANSADIVALLELAEPLSFGRAWALVEERVLGLRRFRQRVHDPGLGPVRWEDDPGFELARHLDQAALEPGERPLREHLGALATEPLEPGRPPWRIRLLSLGRRRSALAVKVHHCLGDGRALIRVLLGMADGVTPAPPAPGRAFRPLGLAEDPLGALRRAVEGPARAMELAGEATAFGAALARLALLPLDRTDALVRPLTGTRRLAWTPAVRTSDAGAAARRAGATPNELVVAAVAGGLRRALPRQADAAEPRALVPVDARAPADGVLGNAFGLVFLDLPTQAETPAARLAAVHERFARVRGSPDAAVTLAVLAGFGLLPRPLEHLATAFFSRKASLVVTNVRGPPARVRLAGAELERLMFWVPHPASLGLGVSILSYAGTIRVGVRADAGVLVEPAALAGAIAGELRALGVPAAEPAPHATRRPRPAAPPPRAVEAAATPGCGAAPPSPAA
ncbi:MAG TPA: WS/DGAT domain-containing protein [Anaeromyxobacter sp.]|nr:WS/DGAT domain-containing protein [Anaeromyxobacter sp.]